jgi:hypothetical protein
MYGSHVPELQQNDMSSSEEEEEEESSFDDKYYEHENFDPQQAYRNSEFYLNNSMHKTNPTATTTTTAISTSTTKKAVDYDPSRHIVQWTPLPTPQQQQGGGGMQDGLVQSLLVQPVTPLGAQSQQEVCYSVSQGCLLLLYISR